MSIKSNSVLLGFIDEKITTKHLKAVDFTTSKIGGTPDWCIDGCEIPKCKKCSCRLVLVNQIYAPLEGSAYHRTLYLFCCASCSQQSHGWVCLRSQLLQGHHALPAERPKERELNDCPSETWFDDEDDWNRMDVDNNITEDKTTASDIYLCTVNKANRPLDNCSNATVEPTSKPIEESMDSDTPEHVGHESFQDSKTEEASAVLEAPENEVIPAVDLQKPQTDIPALLRSSNKISLDKEICFIPYFMTSDLEPHETQGFLVHEEELLRSYTAAANHPVENILLNAACEKQASDCYEKTRSHHGDNLLYKFKKRISRYPQQILRYCRDAEISPLWLRQPSQRDVPTSCRYCKGPMILEFQVMPQLVVHLTVLDCHSPIIEFGTVIIYACAHSCWDEKNVFREEHVLLQQEVV